MLLLLLCCYGRMPFRVHFVAYEMLAQTTIHPAAQLLAVESQIDIVSKLPHTLPVLERLPKEHGLD
jgi:hypothetical protein